jgi:hypothetical protein
MTRRVAALALAGLTACLGEPATDDTGTTAARASAGTATANLDSIATVQRAESLATALDVWNAVEVVSRLEAAGLVVRDLNRPVSAPGFGAEGATLAVSGGELVVFLYPTVSARSAATNDLDSATAAPPGGGPVWPSRPRLITSGNLAAVLLTDREQLAERVRNVLEARHGARAP